MRWKWSSTPNRAASGAVSRNANSTCTPVCTTRTSCRHSTRLRSHRSRAVSLRPSRSIIWSLYPRCAACAPHRSARLRRGAPAGPGERRLWLDRDLGQRLLVLLELDDELAVDRRLELEVD